MLVADDMFVVASPLHNHDLHPHQCDQATQRLSSTHRRQLWSLPHALSAALPRNPGSAAVVLLAVLGSRSVAMLVTQILSIHGLRGHGYVNRL